MKQEKKQNLPMAQETSTTSLGPYFCFLISRRPFGPSVLRSLLSPLRHPLSAARTHDPPREQWLTELGAGAGSFPVVGLFTPHSTPRAVVRGGGWGCCRCCLIPAVHRSVILRAAGA